MTEKTRHCAWSFLNLQYYERFSKRHDRLSVIRTAPSGCHEVIEKFGAQIFAEDREEIGGQQILCPGEFVQKRDGAAGRYLRKERGGRAAKADGTDPAAQPGGFVQRLHGILPHAKEYVKQRAGHSCIGIIARLHCFAERGEAAVGRQFMKDPAGEVRGDVQAD